MTFTQTEYLGLLALLACLCAMGSWLQLRRATTAERRRRRSEFCTCLFAAVFLIGLIGLNFILPAPVSPPSLAASICFSLLFLLALGLVMNELRLAIRARNGDFQRPPADSDR